MRLQTREWSRRALRALYLVGCMTAASYGFAARGGVAPNGEAVAEVRSCGKPGSAPCPMQAFMRARIASPLAASDAAALAAGLEQAAQLSPELSWASWSSFARAGAAAARSGDVAAARASCKGCHEAWREAYRAKYRARPLAQ